MPDNKLDVVICWHMHQPDYRDGDGQYRLPWTYLHAIKDYTDMAAHLENQPRARAVVNFVPILLEQISDYANRIEQFRRHANPLPDPLLHALVADRHGTEPRERLQLITSCLRANKQRLIEPYPVYRKLVTHAQWLENNAEAVTDVTDQFITDLIVWYHLVWTGESVRERYPLIAQLMAKGRQFNSEERHALLDCIGEVMNGVIPRYRRLYEQGRVELSMTPYAHPIMPLLIDFHSARDALPEMDLPDADGYPDGGTRVRWHLQYGIKVFERYFGRGPAGCWPSEGGVSLAAAKVLDEHAFTWIATGESVLRNSLEHDTAGETSATTCLHRSYSLPALGLRCFFRDDGLSDLVGFQYADWHADDAVANLIHHLQNIALACEHTPDRIVSIILDGENAWEYYPRNGYFFLQTLYQRLADHPEFQLTTFSDYLARRPSARALSKLVAGSWVYGTFSTWIGDRDKNRAWEMLVEAKYAVDQQLLRSDYSPSAREAIERQLAICEGSDWFWWFGDYNPAQTVSDFDRLFRQNLRRLYQLLGLPSPDYLQHRFAYGHGTPEHGGVMRHGKLE